MRQVPNTGDRPDVAEIFPEADWVREDVNTDPGSLQENTSAVFRAQVTQAAEDLAIGKIMLQFGMIGVFDVSSL